MFSKIIVIFLLFIWQLPQEILGFIVFLIANEDKRRKITASASCYMYFTHKRNWGVSLGDFVMICEKDTIYDLMHESGHKKQSRILGWFYLLVIGVPSFICACINKLILVRIWDENKRVKWYYNLPWEKWANELEGLDKYLHFD